MLFRSILTLTLLGLALGQVDAPRPDIVIDPLPPLVQCERAIITWSGGRIPYAVGIYPADYAEGGERLGYLGATGETEEQWLVRVPAGETVVVRVWDSLKEAYSEPAVIQDGSDDSCLPQSSTRTMTSSSGGTATRQTSGTASATARSTTDSRSSYPTETSGSRSSSTVQSSTSEELASSSAAPTPGTGAADQAGDDAPNGSLPRWGIDKVGWAIVGSSTGMVWLLA